MPETMLNDQEMLAHLVLPQAYESESEVTQWCLTLCNPVDCSPPGSTVHGILQARILESVAIIFSRGSSQPRSPALQVDSLLSQPLVKPYLSHQGATISTPFLLIVAVFTRKGSTFFGLGGCWLNYCCLVT